MTKDEFIQKLKNLNACESALDWTIKEGGETPQDCWNNCKDQQWMFWLIGKTKFDRKTLVKAACKIARTSLKYAPADELRPLQAIEAAEGWASDNGTTLDQVSAASAAASAAARAAAWAASAARAAAWAAASAAESAAASAAERAAERAAAWAASAARAAASAAASAAAWAAASAASCEIIREYFPNLPLEY